MSSSECVKAKARYTHRERSVETNCWRESQVDTRLLGELVGPSWRDEVDAEAITDETQQWMHIQIQHRVDRAAAGLEAQPEHAALGALIEAWRSGLTEIVEIPCRGTFTRRIGTHAVLVTAETRADPARYHAALTEFRLRR